MTNPIDFPTQPHTHRFWRPYRDPISGELRVAHPRLLIVIVRELHHKSYSKAATARVQKSRVGAVPLVSGCTHGNVCYSHNYWRVTSHPNIARTEGYVRGSSARPQFAIMAPAASISTPYACSVTHSRLAVGALDLPGSQLLRIRQA